eukprot:3154322-Pleurochrysis_carterae.AAC.3
MSTRELVFDAHQMTPYSGTPDPESNRRGGARPTTTIGRRFLAVLNGVASLSTQISCTRSLTMQRAVAATTVARRVGIV